MSELQYGRYDSIARRWLALIERRQEHFLDLCDTGRWRHYFTEAEFLDEMRKVLRVRDQWAAIAGLPPASEDLLADDDLPPPPPPANGVAASAWPD
jgi:uncharacterized repeat protein (TIGR03809 family)